MSDSLRRRKKPGRPGHRSNDPGSHSLDNAVVRSLAKSCYGFPEGGDPSFFNMAPRDNGAILCALARLLKDGKVRRIKVKVGNEWRTFILPA